jgi:hypothetical protein
MLRAMNDGYIWWLLLLGIAIGVVVVWLMAVRLPRRDDDVTDAERAAEARWISATIERDGGIAPTPLVEEILELHRTYLASGTAAVTGRSEVPDPAPGTAYAGNGHGPNADPWAAPAGRDRGR